jgi:hypothetical protein
LRVVALAAWLRRWEHLGSNGLHDVIAEPVNPDLYEDDELEWIAAQISALQAGGWTCSTVNTSSNS